MTLSIPSTTPHLILGSAKSGKSSYAEKVITAFPPPYIYIATAEALDEEMEERIRRHRARRQSLWETIESPLHVTRALTALQGRNVPVLVDCLTLWLSNLLSSQSSGPPEEAVKGLCDFMSVVNYPLFLVSNEVGGGIVPENALARRFRDLAGITHQQIAERCRTVTLVVAGLPVTLKRFGHPTSECPP